MLVLCHGSMLADWAGASIHLAVNNKIAHQIKAKMASKGLSNRQAATEKPQRSIGCDP